MSIPNSVLSAVVIDSNTGTISGASNANPYICIPYSSLSTAINWDNPVTNNLEPWIAGIIQVLATYNTAQIAQSSQAHSIVVAKASGYSVLTRNNTQKKLNRYSCDVYTTDTGVELPDGDFF